MSVTKQWAWLVHFTNGGQPCISFQTQALRDAAVRLLELHKRMCLSCDGCGLVADSESREPWTAWMALPLASATAVLTGIVKPVPCEACSGTGVRLEAPP